MRLLKTVASLTLVLVTLGPALGQQTQPSEEQFHADLVKVRRLMDRRKWEPARQSLVTLLEQHRGKSYVHVRKVEVLEDAKRCVFRSNFEEPQAAELIGGELRSYNERTGAIKLRYAGVPKRDFREESGFHVHPVTFAGPYTVEIKGDQYPQLRSSGFGQSTPAPMILAAAGDQGLYTASFGFKSVTAGNSVRWLPSRLLEVREGKSEVVDEKETSPCAPGKKYSIKVTVTRSEIGVYYNGRKFMRAKNRTGEFGRFGFANLGDFKELLVRGKVQASWLQGVVDSASQQQLKEFEKTYRPEEHLPEWLLADPVPVVGSASQPAPGGEGPGRTAAAERARELLFDGDLVKAKAVLDEAARSGIAASELDSLNRMVVKAMNGPRWGRVHEYSSKHYVIRSDIDRDLCLEAGRVLEEAYLSYGARLHRIAGLEKRKFPVYLFAGESGYKTYISDVMGATPENTAGLYSPALKQLLIWNLPDREDMLRTVRHEGFHQYLDRVMDDPPRWFNEGLAEYYELASRRSGRWEEGQVHAEHLHTLAAYPELDLGEMLQRTPREFYANMSLHYAQAWAFVHFLRQSTPDNQRLFERFFEMFRRGTDPDNSLQSVLDGVDLQVLQHELNAHLGQLRDG